MARDHLGEVGTNVVEIDFLFLGRLVAFDFLRLEVQDGLALHQRDAASAATIDPAAMRRRDQVLHLHRFEHRDCWPRRTMSPSATSIATTVPCIGAAWRPRPPAAVPRLRAPGLVVRAAGSASVEYGRFAQPQRGSRRVRRMGLDEAGADAFSTKSGCARSARAGSRILVATPSMRNSRNARAALAPRRASRRRACTIDLGEQRIEGRVGA